MDFEVRGKVFGMNMPSTWEYYPEGLLVLPEDEHVTFSGEVRDGNGTPIDVIVHKSLSWGGYAVLFRNYTVPKYEIYQIFGVFTNKTTAIYVARLILTCNRAFQYNWRGIISIIMRGTNFDLDTAVAVALLHLMLPKTKNLDPIFNPPSDYEKAVKNPVVFAKRIKIADTEEDARAIKGIERKTRSYTRLFLMNYIHNVPGISFFNEDEFVAEVMHLIESGDDGTYHERWFWTEERFADIVLSMEMRLKEIWEKYSRSDVPTEYLETLVERDTIVAPGYVNPCSMEEEVKKEEASDEA